MTVKLARTARQGPGAGCPSLAKADIDEGYSKKGAELTGWGSVLTTSSALHWIFCLVSVVVNQRIINILCGAWCVYTGAVSGMLGTTYLLRCHRYLPDTALKLPLHLRSCTSA